MPPASAVHPGDRFGRLVVVGEDGRAKNRERMFKCACDCGAEARVMSSNLTRGRQRSCGCGQATIKHGQLGSPTYESWRAMRGRCQYPSNASWRNYGGRGITVCERWLGKDGFANFMADMDERPEGMTLDRIDPDGNYEPGNCRWATWTEQIANRRTAAGGWTREQLAEWGIPWPPPKGWKKALESRISDSVMPE